MLTASQIRLLQTSWRQVLPIQEQAAQLFYDRLFQMDPATRSLFKGDMPAQGRKLMAMITAAVDGITELEELLPVVQGLGHRHAGYGVTAAHYETVGSALLWTLEQGLGPAFTPEVRAAWVSTYGLLASTMQAAAASGAPQ
jgi:hemoglobin-like flavoprotein